HDDSRKVTSTCQIRPSSTGSSNDTHSLVGPLATATPVSLMGSSLRLVPRRSHAPLTLTPSASVASTVGSVRDIADDALLDDLRSALGPDRARAEPLELALYGRDAG